MRKRFLKLSALCLSAGISFAGISVTSLAAEASESADVVGTLGFAQCSEYLNVRSSAEKEAEVIGKLYNNGSVEILDADENGWYHIRSGNVEGYVASEYIATGAEAEEIAATTGYTTAEVGAISLNVRAEASDTSDVVGSASESEELEVVAETGDWVKVVLPENVYGYVSTEYVHVSTEYPTAVTLEEEQAAYQQQAEADTAPEQAAEDIYAAEESGQEDDSYTYEEEQWNDSAADTTASEDGSYTDAASEDSYTDTASDDTYTDNTAETSYTDAAGDTSYTDTAADTSGTDGTGADTSYTDDAAADTSYTDTSAADTSYTDTSAADTSYTDTAADTSGTDAGYTDDTASDSSSGDEAAADTTVSTDSATGQAIANYASQFVGNPYVWGGTSLTNGADCSGFVLSVFANFGISLPHSAASQAGYGTEVSYSDLQPGDLLFYSDGSGISHVAIYVGGGSIVHAANAASGICYSNADYSTPVSCRRLV